MPRANAPAGKFPAGFFTPSAGDRGNSARIDPAVIFKCLMFPDGYLPNQRGKGRVLAAVF